MYIIRGLMKSFWRHIFIQNSTSYYNKKILLSKKKEKIIPNDKNVKGNSCLMDIFRIFYFSYDEFDELFAWFKCLIDFVLLSMS